MKYQIGLAALMAVIMLTAFSVPALAASQSTDVNAVMIAGNNPPTVQGVTPLSQTINCVPGGGAIGWVTVRVYDPDGWNTIAHVDCVYQGAQASGSDAIKYDDTHADFNLKFTWMFWQSPGTWDLQITATDINNAVSPVYTLPSGYPTYPTITYGAGVGFVVNTMPLQFNPVTPGTPATSRLDLLNIANQDLAMSGRVDSDWTQPGVPSISSDTLTVGGHTSPWAFGTLTYGVLPRGSLDVHFQELVPAGTTVTGQYQTTITVTGTGA